MFSPAVAVSNEDMKQSDLDLTSRRTRKRVFLDEMERVVPWREFVALIAPHARRKATDREPFLSKAMLRIYSQLPWFGLSDLAIQEGPYHVQRYRSSRGWAA